MLQKNISDKSSQIELESAMINGHSDRAFLTNQ